MLARAYQALDRARSLCADCVGASNRPTTPGARMRRTSASRASWCIYTGLWIRAVRRSTSCSRPNAMQRRPSAFRAKALGQ
jgi:hypothetical protein